MLCTEHQLHLSHLSLFPSSHLSLLLHSTREAYVMNVMLSICFFLLFESPVSLCQQRQRHFGQLRELATLGFCFVFFSLIVSRACPVFDLYSRQDPISQTVRTDKQCCSMHMESQHYSTDIAYLFAQSCKRFRLRAVTTKCYFHRDVAKNFRHDAVFEIN